MASGSDSERLNRWMNKTRLNCLDDGGCLVWQGYCGKSGVPSGWSWDVRNGSLRRHVYEASGKLVRKNYAVVMTCDNKKCLNPDHMAVKSKKDVMHENHENMNPIAAAKKAQINRSRNGKIGFDGAADIRGSLLHPKELAAKYGVNVKTIYRVKNGEAWVHQAGGLFSGLMR